MQLRLSVTLVSSLMQLALLQLTVCRMECNQNQLLLGAFP